jgi:hypothetical protein
MNNTLRTLVILAAGAFALVSVSAFADDPTPDKMKQEADAKKTSDAEALKHQDAMMKSTQNPQGKNVGITKSADDAKAAKAKKDAEMAKMTPQQKAAAKKARQTQAQKHHDAMMKATQNPQGKNAGISKSAVDSAAGPTPPSGTMNTPEVEKALKQQKGQ